MIKKLFTALSLGLLLAAAVTPPTWAENVCDLNQGSVGPRSLTEACDEAGKAIAKEPMKTLQRVVVEQQLRVLARILRRTPEASKIDAFVYTPIVTAFLQYCCTCIPGKTCSAGHFTEVCDYLPGGSTCPAGTLRAICSPVEGGGNATCDSID